MTLKNTIFQFLYFKRMPKLPCFNVADSAEKHISVRLADHKENWSVPGEMLRNVLCTPQCFVWQVPAEELEFEEAADGGQEVMWRWREVNGSQCFFIKD